MSFPIYTLTTCEINYFLQVGMCIMEHLEVLEYSGIFISNPEYQILDIWCTKLVTVMQGLLT